MNIVRIGIICTVLFCIGRTQAQEFSSKQRSLLSENACAAIEDIPFSPPAPETPLESSSTETKLPGLDIPRQRARSEVHPRKNFDWVSASQQSFYFLAMEHSVRLTQDKTRRNLGGRFFHEWMNAASGLEGWSDGDGVLTNYIGHPMQGAITGWIQIHNDPSGIAVEYSHTREYWFSRLRAGAWSTFYSTQFELGPISEASIGRVGYVDGQRGQAGSVDLVMTPIAGTGLIIAEDAIDKYWVKKLESSTDNIPMRRFYRVALNPNRSFANLLRFKVPWHRDTRTLRHDQLLSTDGLKDSTPAK